MHTAHIRLPSRPARLSKHRSAARCPAPGAAGLPRAVPTCTMIGTHPAIMTCSTRLPQPQLHQRAGSQAGALTHTGRHGALQGRRHGCTRRHGCGTGCGPAAAGSLHAGRWLPAALWHAAAAGCVAATCGAPQRRHAELGGAQVGLVIVALGRVPMVHLQQHRVAAVADTQDEGLQSVRNTRLDRGCRRLPSRGGRAVRGGGRSSRMARCGLLRADALGCVRASVCGVRGPGAEPQLAGRSAPQSWGHSTP